MMTLFIFYYENKGPKPRDLASVIWLYLLLILTNLTLSLDVWVDALHRIQLYVIVSGFTPCHTSASVHSMIFQSAMGKQKNITHKRNNKKGM